MGGERGITDKSRPPGLIAERIEAQAVPPPYTMSPGSRRHIGSPPLRLPGFPPPSPERRVAVDVRRLGLAGSVWHRQNYVPGYVSEQRQMPGQRAVSNPAYGPGRGYSGFNLLHVYTCPVGAGDGWPPDGGLTRSTR